MLISVVMDPTCLSPDILACPEARFGAERLLEGVIDNGFLLVSDRQRYVRNLTAAALKLESKTGQKIQVLVTEISKNSSRFVVEDDRALRTESAAQNIGLSQLHQLAPALSADIVVCRNVRDARRRTDLHRAGIEVCTLADYGSSATEANRKDWSTTTRIDNLPPDECARVVGRVIRYATEIIVVDRYFARSAKDEIVGKVRRFARGLIYLVDCWKQHSPYAHSCLPKLQVFSVAGGTAPYIDPEVARRTMRRAVSELDSNCSLTIHLKDDQDPSIIAERFISAMGRCFNVQHGIDSLGNLALQNMPNAPTFLAPDCQAHRDLFAEIRALKPSQ